MNYRTLDYCLVALEKLGASQLKITATFNPYEMWEVRTSQSKYSFHSENSVVHLLNLLIKEYRSIDPDVIKKFKKYHEDPLREKQADYTSDFGIFGEAPTERYKCLTSKLLKLEELGSINPKAVFHYEIGLLEFYHSTIHNHINHHCDHESDLIQSLDDRINEYLSISENVRNLCIENNFDPGHLIDLTFEDDDFIDFLNQHPSMDAIKSKIRLYSKKPLKSIPITQGLYRGSWLTNY